MSQFTVTQEQIDVLLDEAEVQEHKFHYGKSLIVSFKLKSGFTVDGRASMLDPSFYDHKVGQDLARRDASRQLWTLEAYHQNKLRSEQQ